MGIFSWLFGGSGSAGAEDRQFADVQAFRDYVLDAARKRFADVNVVPDLDDPAGFQIAQPGDGGRWTMNVGNLYRRFLAYPDFDLEYEVNKFLSVMDSGSVEESGFDNLVVVLRSLDYVEHLASIGQRARHEFLMGDVATILMVDSPEFMSPLSESEFADKDMDELTSIAVGNVLKWLPNITSTEAPDSGTLFFVESNTFLTSSLVLLDEFWALIEKDYSEGALFILPRTDQLFVYDATDPNAADAARAMIDVTFQDGFNLLSNQIFQRRGGGISLFAN